MGYKLQEAMERERGRKADGFNDRIQFLEETSASQLANRPISISRRVAEDIYQSLKLTHDAEEGLVAQTPDFSEPPTEEKTANAGDSILTQHQLDQLNITLPQE